MHFIKFYYKPTLQYDLQLITMQVITSMFFNCQISKRGGLKPISTTIDF